MSSSMSNGAAKRRRGPAAKSLVYEKEFPKQQTNLLKNDVEYKDSLPVLGLRDSILYMNHRISLLGEQANKVNQEEIINEMNTLKSKVGDSSMATTSKFKMLQKENDDMKKIIDELRKEMDGFKKQSNVQDEFMNNMREFMENGNNINTNALVITSPYDMSDCEKLK